MIINNSESTVSEAFERAAQALQDFNTQEMCNRHIIFFDLTKDYGSGVTASNLVRAGKYLMQSPKMGKNGYPKGTYFEEFYRTDWPKTILVRSYYYTHDDSYTIEPMNEKLMRMDEQEYKKFQAEYNSEL